MFSYGGAKRPESKRRACFVQFRMWRHRERSCCLRLKASSVYPLRQNGISILTDLGVSSDWNSLNVDQFKQGVALTGRNRTFPPCVVGRRTGHAPGPVAADRPRALQTTTDDADRRQRAKQHWPIRRAISNVVFGTEIVESQLSRMYGPLFVTAAGGSDWVWRRRRCAGCGGLWERETDDGESPTRDCQFQTLESQCGWSGRDNKRRANVERAVTSRSARPPGTSVSCRRRV